MDTEGLEIRIIGKNSKNITYWENDVMVGRKCSKCGEDKPISEFRVARAYCKECVKDEKRKWRKNNPDKKREHDKRYREKNADKVKEMKKKYYENNFDKVNEKNKKWHENNPNKTREHKRKYYENNIGKVRESSKKSKKKAIENNIQKITNLVEQTNEIFKKLSLTVYGYIYKFENIKTGRVYIGQTTYPLKMRYSLEGGIVKSWIKERLAKNNQKFKDELTEEDIQVTEMIDTAFCQYHLDKLEAYYINKYDSCNNGYNNKNGNHNTDDGIEEFNRILKENNLKFINGKLERF